MGARLGLVVVHDLVGTRPRFSRDARIGCTRAELYGHDRAMWLVYRNAHMQLKGKGMQLKVKDMQLKMSMQKNIEEKRIKKGYMFTLFFSSFFFTQLYSLLLAN